jgi:hypothetical protein
VTSFAKISFVDVESGSEGFFGIRAEGEALGLSVSLRSDGDIEVFVRKTEIDALINALQEAKEQLSAP